MDYFVAASIASFPPLEQCLLKAISALKLKDHSGELKIAMKAYEAIRMQERFIKETTSILISVHRHVKVSSFISIQFPLY